MKDDAKARAHRNRDLVQRVRNGESINLVDASATWFPPRPIIKKDARAIMQLQGIEPLKVETMPVLLLTRDE